MPKPYPDQPEHSAELDLLLRLRRAQLVREDAVFRGHQLVLRAAGGFLHRDQVVERREEDSSAAYVALGCSRLERVVARSTNGIGE